MGTGMCGLTLRKAVGGWLLAATMLLAACGGGGGGSSTGGGGGDTTGGGGGGAAAGADYFPLAIGDRWFYDEGGAMSRIDVIGTRSVTGGTAMVVRAIDVDGTSESQYLKTSTGVTAVPAAGDDPILVALGPLQLLKLPIVEGDRWVLVDKQLTAVADVDGDGRAENIGVRIEATVIGFETVTVGGQTYTRAAHVRTTLTRSGQLTSNGQAFSETSVADDWYAPDLGPVRTLTTLTVGGQSQRSDSLLTAWRVGNRRSESVAPTLTARAPATGATVYGGFPTLQVSFSEPMDTLVPAGQVWTLTGPDGQPVAGEARWLPGDRAVAFTHLTALPSGRYTARVTGAAADLVGNTLAADSSWTFDLDSSGPAPTPVSPLPGAAEVPLDSVIVFTLDEDPDPATVNASNVRLSDLSRSEFVDATVTLAGRTVTLRPKEALRTGSRYQVTVDGVTDTHGNTTSGLSWGFTADPGQFAAPQRLIDNNAVTAVAIGDVDGDGRADALMVTGYDSGSPNGLTLFVRRGLGSAQFAPAQRVATTAAFGAEVGSMQVADLDRNGKGVVVLAGGTGLQILRAQPDGSLVTSQVIATTANTVVRVADMDGDGRLDLVSANFGGTTVSVWLQGVDGRFGAAIPVTVTSGAFSGFAVGDIDGDGRPDIAALEEDHPGSRVALVLRTAGGGYAPPVVVAAGRLANQTLGTIAIGDVTGDGRADLVVSERFASQFDVLAQRSDGSWADPVAVAAIADATGLRLTDMDGDRRTDVVSWSWGGAPVALHRQRSDGTLRAEGTWPVADYGVGTADVLAVGDLDGDGRPDLLYASAWLRQRAVAVAASPAASLTGSTRVGRPAAWSSAIRRAVP